MKEVEYIFSTYERSRFSGYHMAGSKPTVKVFLFELWYEMETHLDKQLTDDELIDEYVNGLNGIILLERICLERAFNHIRMKNRCRPICKMHKIAENMINLFES